MTRVLAAANAVVVLALMLMPQPAFAGHGNSRHYGPVPSSYDGTMPPEAYSNCLPWSPKLHNWVWICGPPYPPNYPAIH